MGKFIIGIITAFASGFSIGATYNFVGVSTSSFAEGRNSVLQTPVDVRTDLCGHVTIPLEVLADMVNAGVMDWQKACMEKATR